MQKKQLQAKAFIFKWKKKISIVLSQYVMYFKIEKRSKRLAGENLLPLSLLLWIVRTSKFILSYANFILQHTESYSFVKSCYSQPRKRRNTNKQRSALNKQDFFAQSKKLPMGYRIWYLPPAGLTA